jgi:pentatricopeptide repeat protein
LLLFSLPHRRFVFSSPSSPSLLMPRYAKLQDVDAVHYWYAEMAQHGIAPMISTFTTIIDMYGKLRIPEQALAWYQCLVFSGLTPDLTTYHTLIGTLVGWLVG